LPRRRRRHGARAGHPLLEEDKVCAYYGAGTLFATPDRAEPFM